MRRHKSKETRLDLLYPLIFSGDAFVLAVLGMLVGVLQWIYFPRIDVLAIFIVAMMAAHKDGAFAAIGIISVLLAIVFGVNGVPWLHHLYVWILLGVIVRRLPPWNDDAMLESTLMHALILIIYELFMGPLEVVGYCILHPSHFLEMFDLIVSGVLNNAIRMALTGVACIFLPLMYKLVSLVPECEDDDEEEEKKDKPEKK